MNNIWIATKKTVNGYFCIEHSITKQLTLVGIYGEIWQTDSHEFRAIIYSPRIAKKYLPESLWPEYSDEDILIRFRTEDLPLWIRRLLVPKKSSTQLLLANKIKSTAEQYEVTNE